MKKLIVVILTIFFAGCSSVTMTPRYRYQVETAAVVVNELDQRCADGDDVACKEGLHKASETLNLIVDAMYGRVDNE